MLGLLGTVARGTRGDAADGLEAAAAIEDAFVTAIQKAEPAVVAISRERVPVNPPPVFRGPWNLRRNRFGNVGDDRAAENVDPVDPLFAPSEFGSGVIIDEAGLILTNYHLVQGSAVFGRDEKQTDQRLFVRLSDRRVLEAEILAGDPRSDLAVVRVNATGLPTLKLAAAAPVRKGQIVIALGNPYAIARDGSASASWGIVSNLTRRIPHQREMLPGERQQKETLYHLGVLVQIDTRLELGTSGGALLNLKGELIGLTTSLAAILGYEKSAGFAIQLDEQMLRVIESLRQGKEVEYGFLGVMPEDVNVSRDPIVRDQAELIAQGGAARVKNDPEPNLPAFERLRQGDLILRINDVPILSRTDLMRVIGLAGPLARVKVDGFRPTQNRGFNTDVVLGKWPVMDDEGIVATRPTWDPWRGMTYDFSSARWRSFQRISQNTQLFHSVLVRDVRPDSPVDRAKIQKDDHITHVAGRAVRNPREFHEAVQKLDEPVTLRVWSEANGRGESREVQVSFR